MVIENVCSIYRFYLYVLAFIIVIYFTITSFNGKLLSIITIGFLFRDKGLLMMEKILVIDLTAGRVEERPYTYKEYQACGRGLALRLMREFVPEEEERLGEGNAILLVPGLFAGCPAPSACRLIVAAKRGSRQGMGVCNTTGNLPQKLGSLGIAAVVIKGKSEEEGTVVQISAAGVRIGTRKKLCGVRTSEIVRMLKEEFGSDCAAIGIGKAGDMRLSLSTFFCTYPDGEPSFHCPRNGFGDIFGAKNLRAVVVSCDSYFGRECKNPDIFRETGKKIARRIVADDVCGGALPACGSVTLLKILADRNAVSQMKGKEKEKAAKAREKSGGKKINYCCAPMCVVGCLNRHSSGSGERYSSPVQSEIQAALKNCFGFEDYALAKEIQDEAGEIGIVGTEYVTAAKVFAEAEGIRVSGRKLLEWLSEHESSYPDEILRAILEDGKDRPECAGEEKPRRQSAGGETSGCRSIGEKKPGNRKVLATIVAKRGVSPRRVGTKMLVLPDGSTVGTVGGGAAEAAVRRLALEMTDGGDTVRLFQIDMDGNKASDSGMACGGAVDVLLEAIEQS